MRFQKRDGEIVMMVFQYGGVLARRQLKARFWPGATLRATQKRLAQLVGNSFLARPTNQQRRTQPIPEPVYWLAWKGAIWAAQQHGVAVAPPSNEGENQMRRFAKRLRDRGIRWLREPRWLQLPHDLAVVDFRLAIERSINEMPGLDIEAWRNESEFRSDGDTVAYRIVDRDGQVVRRTKRVYPDSYFVIMNRRRADQGLLARARFLLEFDSATHSNERFGREKVAPGLAYIKTPSYKARFGDNSGRWLVVTTGKRRRQNLMRQARQVAGPEAGVFLFTTSDQLAAGNVLQEPIWWQVGRTDPIPLISQG